MKKNRFLAVGLALSLAVGMSMNAFAVDGTEPTTPEESNHSATIVADSQGTITSVTNDDDALAAAADLNGADINVWAKVLDSSTKIYKVDIGWGSMKFEFTSTAGQWNPESHSYGNGESNAAWTVDNYLDGENNKITVTNHSNNAVDASFTYTMTEQMFNATETASSVVGNFFAGNDKAVTAAGERTNVANVTDTLTDSKVSLHTADAYGTVENPTDATGNVAAGARTADVFFAFSGTPDEGKGATLNDFTKVGVITVTVEPNMAMAGEYAPYVAQ